MMRVATGHVEQLILPVMNFGKVACHFLCRWFQHIQKTVVSMRTQKVPSFFNIFCHNLFQEPTKNIHEHVHILTCNIIFDENHEKEFLVLYRPCISC